MYALSKTTPDGLFVVHIESRYLAPSCADISIPGASLQQLVNVLDELAQAVRLMIRKDDHDQPS